jgi:hypothetical protein
MLSGLLPIALTALVAAGCGGGGAGTAADTAAQGSDTTAAPAPGIGAPGVIANCKSAESKPKSILVACGDAGFVLEDLEWQKWDADGAEGTGTASVNSCDPNCAEGTFGKYEVGVTLSKFKDCKDEPLFTEVTVSFMDEAPKGYDNPFSETLGCGPG